MSRRPLDLEKTVVQLISLAQLMSRGANSHTEGESFYRLLRQVFELPEEREAEITNLAMSALLELGDPVAAKFLLDELELDAQLQDLKDERGRTWSCLLFAIPVVVPCGDQVERVAREHESLEFMHEVLHDSEVVSQSGMFGLVPRLFSFEEMQQWTFSGLSRLTRHLGQQVLEGCKVVQMPPQAAPCGKDTGSCSAYVDLYYVLGVAAIAPSELEDVFPELPDETEAPLPQMAVTFDEDGALVLQGTGPYGARQEHEPLEQEDQDEETPGQPYDGEQVLPWEIAFCEALNDAFSVVQGALTALPPGGLLEDVRRGQALAREIGLRRMLDVHCAEAPRVVLGALQKDTDSGERFVDVACMGESALDIVETARWPVFPHESEEESLEALYECLADANARVVDENGVFRVGQASLLMH